MNSDRYYQASGSAPVVGLLITLAIGMIGGCVLSVLYSALVVYNPYVYLNLLAGGGFAFACGWLSRFGVTIGKVRNHLLAGVAGAAVGFIALYFAWVTFVYFMVGNGRGGGLITFDFNEILFWMKRIGADGWWAFNQGAGNFKGWGLYLLWAVEAIVVIGASAFVAFSKDTPFCEDCNRWCDEQECPVTFALPQDFEALQASLEADDYSPLYETAQLSPDADVFLKAKLYPCQGCDETSWLKLEHVAASLDKNGEIQTQETTLINYLDIPREDYDRLMGLVPGSDMMPANQEVQDESDVPDVPPGDEEPVG